MEGGYSNDKGKMNKGGKTKYGIIEVGTRKYGYKGDMKDAQKILPKIFIKINTISLIILTKIKDKRVALSIIMRLDNK